jgi:hypothetical protein
MPTKKSTKRNIDVKTITSAELRMRRSTNPVIDLSHPLRPR